MSKKRRSSPIASIVLKAALLPVKFVIAVIVFIDEMLRPIYRPIVRAILENPAFAILERRISALPRWAILIAFAIPFLIAEPLKLVAVILAARGQAVVGVVTFLVAQLLTFILVERIFHAGRAKLLSYWWLAWAVHRARDVRDALHAMGKRILRRLKAFARLHARS